MTDLFATPVLRAQHLDVAVSHGPTWTTIAPCGEIDLGSAESLRQCVAGDHAGDTLILDLRLVSFMDSTALSVIAQAARDQQPGRLRIVSNDPKLLQLFRITGMDQVLDIRRTMTEAEESLAG